MIELPKQIGLQDLLTRIAPGAVVVVFLVVGIAFGLGVEPVRLSTILLEQPTNALIAEFVVFLFAAYLAGILIESTCEVTIDRVLMRAYVNRKDVKSGRLHDAAIQRVRQYAGCPEQEFALISPQLFGLLMQSQAKTLKLGADSTEYSFIRSITIVVLLGAVSSGLVWIFGLPRDPLFLKISLFAFVIFLWLLVMAYLKLVDVMSFGIASLFLLDRNQSVGKGVEA